MTNQRVLPVSGARLASLPQVRERARQDAERLGVDLLDDAVAARVLADHQRLRDRGGWHDELGGMLVIAGVVAAPLLGGSLGSPVRTGTLVQFVAACAAVPLGILVWIAGSNQGVRKRTAAERFLAYTALLEQARAGGVAVPVSPAWTAERAGVPARHGDGSDLLPLPVQAFTEDRALRQTAARLGAEHRIDYLDEQAVRGLLGAQKEAVGRMRRGTALLSLGLLATAGCTGLGLTLAPGSSGRTGLFAAAGVLGLLTALPLGQLLRALRGWRADGVRDASRGYLLLLGAARRRGVTVPPLPSWLDVNGTSKKWR